jgi:hypothetical protein
MIASRVTQTTQAAGNAAGGGIWATGDNGPGQLGLGGQVYVPEVWTLNQTEQLIDRPTVVSAGWHSLALDARG